MTGGGSKGGSDGTGRRRVPLVLGAGVGLPERARGGAMKSWVEWLDWLLTIAVGVFLGEMLAWWVTGKIVLDRLP